MCVYLRYGGISGLVPACLDPVGIWVGGKKLQCNVENKGHPWRALLLPILGSVAVHSKKTYAP